MVAKDRSHTTDSPTVEVGEIDTRAPFQSVKDAVSLFGEGAFSGEKSAIKKTKPHSAERVLATETQLHLAQKELNKLKEQLNNAETTKAEALLELEKAKRTIEDLTQKIETVTDSKETAIKATDAAKDRAKQLEETSGGYPVVSNGAWKPDLESKREQYVTAITELDAAKQLLRQIRQDCDVTLEAKADAFKQAKEAERAAKANAEKVGKISKEITAVQESIGLVKLATMQAKQEQAKIFALKDVQKQSCKATLEELSRKLLALKKDFDPGLTKDLEAKLAETVTEIGALQKNWNATLQLIHQRERERERMIANGIEDEDKWLAEGIAGIQHNAFYMHRSLDSNNLREALKYSAQMLSELRTSRLSPHKYFELYMRAFDELRRLEIFFKEEDKHGCTVSDLYELVQHAGNILPRLYLLCTVGSVYIKSKDAPAKDVLKDLVEMCRGVQHPIRGLFLRSYLAQVSRDKLPDIVSENEGDAETIMDAVEFVLQNFIEMNKLWVRMQLQGPVRVKEKRDKERSELRDLVGKNLHVLSQIEGVDLEMYKDTVLPRVLEQVVNCKDELAQYYLMDCIIQVFPDEYHLQTLEALLGACSQLQPAVDIKTVLSRLMERLSNYAASSPEVLPEFLQVEAFAKLSSAIGKVIEAQVDMPIVGAITLFVSLLTFTLRVHPDRLDCVDQVLGSCVKKLSGKAKLEDSKATKQVVALLTAPLEKYNDIVTALTLSNYPCVMDYLDNGTNKVMAMVIVQSIMKNNTCISTTDKVEVLFELIKGLIKDLDGTLADELDEEDFKEEQNSVARLIHMLHNDDPEEMLKIICTVRKHIMTGGPNRLPFTVPPLVFSALKLIRQLQGQDGEVDGEEVPATPKKIFQLLNQTIETLSSVQSPELALRLYLQCAEAANDSDLEPVAYEFFTQAFMLYEEEVADSKAQVTAIHLIIGTLQRMTVFGVENRDTLTHKATGYSAKLLKKPDQCRAVYACSHLFWVDDQDGIKDGERVLLCLKRSLRIANAAQHMANVARGSSGPVTLFVEILNKYLYFFEKGNPLITSDAIQSLVELIKTEMQSDTTTPDKALNAFFASVLRYIQFQKQKGGAMGEKYSTISM